MRTILFDEWYACYGYGQKVYKEKETARNAGLLAGCADAAVEHIYSGWPTASGRQSL